ncbi:hypothetical protein ASD37_08290 [Mycobacterium sp. Root135]|uniref:hypothetical protein n=1 Tax=Mycobacterium sp. Root135 TaxID=1736457 RepID=UPI000700ACDF|nr:hypothetical protein [Mycobacterium sp. Root135]KQY07962.1 hypothetical protein ASD37_08290 [Mycobacterium sp. Root135]
MTADGNEHVPAFEPGGAAVGESPASARNTHQLIWDRDAAHLDGDDFLEAQGDDWKYTIYPVCGHDGETIGYHVSGGDNDSRDDIGSTLLYGKRGELTLPKARAAAEANYVSRYREAEQFLDDLLDDWEDDDGDPLTRRNDSGRIVCRVDVAGIDEVEVVVTLHDYGDGFDATSRRATVSLRTVLAYSYNGDREGLIDDLGRLIRLESRRSDK